MSLLELPTNPPPAPEPPKKLRSSRYGEMEEHELIRLMDSINDERARGRFRESIYISLFVWIAIAWFVLYGPQVIFHRARLVDPSSVLRERERERIAQLSLPPSLRRAAPRPTPAAKSPAIDSKTLAKLHAPAPTPAPAPPPPPANTQPTVMPPVTPPPTPPRTPPPPTAIPDAPAPTVSFNTPSSAGSAVRDAANAASRSSGSGYIPTSPSRSGRRGAQLGAGVKILSDTQGVNFDDYMRRLHDIIQSHWDPLLPEEIMPPISAKGITGIRFKILPNGQLGGAPILVTKSGDIALDKAAWGGIISSGVFPTLPKEYIERSHGGFLELECGFFVNIQPPSE